MFVYEILQNVVLETNQSQIGSEDLEVLKSERQEYMTQSEELRNQLSALQEELKSNHEQIQILCSEKESLQQKKQELEVLQMESAVTNESKCLAGSVLSEVEISELKSHNDNLVSLNEKLSEDCEKGLRELNAIKEQLNKRCQEMVEAEEFFSQEKQQMALILQQSQDTNTKLQSEFDEMKVVREESVTANEGILICTEMFVFFFFANVFHWISSTTIH